MEDLNTPLGRRHGEFWADLRVGTDAYANQLIKIMLLLPLWFLLLLRARLTPQLLQFRVFLLPCRPRVVR